MATASAGEFKFVPSLSLTTANIAVIKFQMRGYLPLHLKIIISNRDFIRQ